MNGDDRRKLCLSEETLEGLRITYTFNTLYSNFVFIFMYIPLTVVVFYSTRVMVHETYTVYSIVCTLCQYNQQPNSVPLNNSPHY